MKSQDTAAPAGLPEDLRARAAAAWSRDPRRRRVHRLLGRVGPNLQQLFRDGCAVVDGVYPLETAVNVLGNSAREIESGVRGVLREITRLEPIKASCDIERCPKCDAGIEHVTGESHRQEIAAIVHALAIEDPEVSTHWLILVNEGLPALTHRRFLERAPVLGDEHRRTWRTLEDLLALLLPHLETRFTAALPRARDLALIERPSGNDLKRLRAQPNTTRTRAEFYSNATPGWFDLLDRAHFFDEVADGFIRDEVTHQLRPQEWPQTRYLERMARLADQQEHFVAVLEKIEVPHEWALRDLVIAARELPAALMYRTVGCFTRWAGQQSYIFLVADELTKVAVLVAQHGRVDLGEELLAALLRLAPDPRAGEQRTEREEIVFRPEPVSVLRDFDYERCAKTGLVGLAEVDYDGGLSLGLELLVKSLEYSERPERVAERRDTSTTWRHSLAGGRRYGHDFPDALVDAIRELISIRLKTAAGDLHATVDRLGAADWTLPRRIALEVLREHAEVGDIDERLREPTWIRRAGSTPEYLQLLRERGPVWDTAARLSFVAIVEETASSIDEERRHDWVVTRLRPIRGLLEPHLLTRYPELTPRPKPQVVGAGALELADEDLEDGWVGDKPLLSKSKLAEMEIDEVVAKLKTWTPRPEFGAPTVEGQADAIRDATKSDPGRWASAAPRFIDLNSSYVNGLVNGLALVIEETKDPETVAARRFDWASVLELLQGRLKREIGSREDGSIAAPAAHLMANAFYGALRLPISLRKEAWAVVEMLASRMDPDEDGFDDRGDPRAAALASPSATALASVVSYVDWVHENGAHPNERDAMRETPEAAALIAQRLDRRTDARLSTRGVLGMRLVRLIALDPAWVRERLALLFPAAEPEVRRATWQAYIAESRPYNDVYEVLEDEYLHAAAELRIDEPAPEEHRDAAISLAEHLALLYLRGKIEIDGPLLQTFYGRAPARARTRAIQTIGWCMQESTIPEPACARARRLFEWRRDTVRERSREERRVELEHFGLWFTSAGCDEDWLRSTLIETLELTGSIEVDSLVMDKLVAIVPTHPVDAVRALTLMIDEPKESWHIGAWAPEIVAIIEGAMGTEAEHAARALGSRLIADNHNIGLEKILGA